MVVANPEDKARIKAGLMSKTSAYKKRVKEDRPSKAIGTISFKFDKDPQTGQSRLVSAEWVADTMTHSIAEWISMGTCRRDPNAVCELTPWQLGQDVLNMLPTKPGEKFLYAEGEEDGEGGHWVTHKPFPQVRCYERSVPDFQRSFDEALDDEREALNEEQETEIVNSIVGDWVSITDEQAVWRAITISQFDGKVPDSWWGYGTRVRPAEVVYIKSKGKVIIDGTAKTVEALLRALKTFTKPDNNAIMPIYDVNRMSA